jgi:putative ABC transport system ATP-binding protein
MGKILEMTDVTKVYHEGSVDVTAVDSVSLELHKGEVLLLIGPSGSGKTTLLSMMGCILHPTKGEIKVNGEVVSNLLEDELPKIRKRYFGFVFQAFNLFPSLTAMENIEICLRLKHWKKEKIRPEALKLLDRVGLHDRTSFYPGDLSGGEKQRVAFARAMVGDPPIILADEPTANLDSKRGMELLGLLKQYAKKFERSVAVVSHDAKAEAVADRTMVLEDGRIKT